MYELSSPSLSRLSITR